MSKKNQNHSQSYVTAEGKTVIPSWCQAFPGTHDQLRYDPSVWSSISDDSASRTLVNRYQLLGCADFRIYAFPFSKFRK
jgi:hypothetical protein